MRLLLDTHIWLWLMLTPERLHKRVAAAIEDPDSELWLSSVSIWETLMVTSKGQLDLGAAPADWIVEALSASGIREAVMNNRVALETGRMAFDHKDPAARMLVATARVMELTLVTADKTIVKARPCDLLANR